MDHSRNRKMMKMILDLVDERCLVIDLSLYQIFVFPLLLMRVLLMKINQLII